MCQGEEGLTRRLGRAAGAGGTCLVEVPLEVPPPFKRGFRQILDALSRLLPTPCKTENMREVSASPRRSATATQRTATEPTSSVVPTVKKSLSDIASARVPACPQPGGCCRRRFSSRTSLGHDERSQRPEDGKEKGVQGKKKICEKKARRERG